MKKVISVCSFCLLMTTIVFAQHNNKQYKQHNKEEALQKLNLSQQQQAQLKTINANFKEKEQSLKANDNTTLGEFNKQKQALQQEKNAQVQATLTTEQKAKLEEIKSQKKAEHEAKNTARFEKMKTKLELTATQEASLKAKQDELKSKAQTIKQNSNLSKEEKKEQIKVIKKDRKEYLKSVLTEQQLQKLKASKK